MFHKGSTGNEEDLNSKRNEIKAVLFSDDNKKREDLFDFEVETSDDQVASTSLNKFPNDDEDIKNEFSDQEDQEQEDIQDLIGDLDELNLNFPVKVKRKSESM